MSFVTQQDLLQPQMKDEEDNLNISINDEAQQLSDCAFQYSESHRQIATIPEKQNIKYLKGLLNQSYDFETNSIITEIMDDQQNCVTQGIIAGNLQVFHREVDKDFQIKVNNKRVEKNLRDFLIQNPDLAKVYDPNKHQYGLDEVSRSLPSLPVLSSLKNDQLKMQQQINQQFLAKLKKQKEERQIRIQKLQEKKQTIQPIKISQSQSSSPKRQPVPNKQKLQDQITKSWQPPQKINLIKHQSETMIKNEEESENLDQTQVQEIKSAIRESKSTSQLSGNRIYLYKKKEKEFCQKQTFLQQQSEQQMQKQKFDLIELNKQFKLNEIKVHQERYEKLKQERFAKVSPITTKVSPTIDPNKILAQERLNYQKQYAKMVKVNFKPQISKSAVRKPPPQENVILPQIIKNQEKPKVDYLQELKQKRQLKQKLRGYKPRETPSISQLRKDEEAEVEYQFQQYSIDLDLDVPMSNRGQHQFDSPKVQDISSSQVLNTSIQRVFDQRQGSKQRLMNLDNKQKKTRNPYYAQGHHSVKNVQKVQSQPVLDNKSINDYLKIMRESREKKEIQKLKKFMKNDIENPEYLLSQKEVKESYQDLAKLEKNLKMIKGMLK